MVCHIDRHEGRGRMVDEETVPDLPRLLRQLRRRDARRRGGPELTYRELASRTGWSLGIIAQYFSGKTMPSIDRFDVLIRVLGASPAEQGAMATARDRRTNSAAGRRRPAPVPGRMAARSGCSGRCRWWDRTASSGWSGRASGRWSACSR
jgi:transcriptional regulator with XRE-family HTH domain